MFSAPIRDPDAIGEAHYATLCNEALITPAPLRQLLLFYRQYPDGSVAAE